MQINDDERVMALEIKATYIEDFLNSIQAVVLAQGKEIEQLGRENKLLKEKIAELQDASNVDIPSRKPPHY